MVRTRPLADATLESRLKAKRLSESIQSFRPRPETCAALARRLVTGALGVKLPTARQEREEEKRVLREARGNSLDTFSVQYLVTYQQLYLLTVISKFLSFREKEASCSTTR